MPSTLLLACLLAAQAAPDASTPSDVRAALDAAKLDVAAAVAARGEEYNRVDKLTIADVDKRPMFDAAADRCRRAIAPPVGRLLDAVDRAPADPLDVEALRFVLVEARSLQGGEMRRALALLGRDHARDGNASLATGVLFLHHDEPSALDFGRKVLAENPGRIERGRACYDLAYALRSRLNRAERLLRAAPGEPLPADVAGADPDALRAEAGALLDRVLAEFADVPTIPYPGFPESTGKTIGRWAEGDLFALRNVREGVPAPEVEGLDVDGRPLRLSDHRGKVVVLIFSGQWCGPCRAESANLRALLEPANQAKAPCVVLEVNTDRKAEPLRAAIASGEIRWPCWFDGGTEGPITSRWGVSSFPTIHVIDADGILRAVNLRGEAVALAVARASEGRKP